MRRGNAPQGTKRAACLYKRIEVTSVGEPHVEEARVQVCAASHHGAYFSIRTFPQPFWALAAVPLVLNRLELRNVSMLGRQLQP